MYRRMRDQYRILRKWAIYASYEKAKRIKLEQRKEWLKRQWYAELEPLRLSYIHPDPAY